MTKPQGVLTRHWAFMVLTALAIGSCGGDDTAGLPPCPPLHLASQASALNVVENAIELGIGNSLLQNADPSSLRPITSGPACKALEKLVNPDYSITGNQPEFLVNYFWVDTTLPGPLVLPISIVVLRHNVEVSTVDGPTIFLVYFTFTDEPMETYLST